MLTTEDDGLTAPWHGRVWLNPPYGDSVGKWCKRLALHGRGTLLIFARTETSWWHEHIWPRATAILFLRGRLYFCRPDGFSSEHNAGGPSALVAYGDHDAEILERQKEIEGRYVCLK